MLLRWLRIAMIGLALLFPGCGGGSNGPSAGFVIASGNWTIPLTASGGPPAAVAGGSLTQSGTMISGTLRITGSPCFDPIADQLMVSGTVASDFNSPNSITFSSQPVRGQVLSVSGTWDRTNAPTLGVLSSPPKPVTRLVGTATVTGGSCAEGAQAKIILSDFTGTFSGGLGNAGSPGNLTAVMSQTGPDALGFFRVSGTFTITGSPCFTSGTIGSTVFAGALNPMNVTTDSGQLTGFAQRIVDLSLFSDAVFFSFTVHGGSCDGQTVSGLASKM